MNHACQQNIWCANNDVGAAIIAGACPRKKNSIDYYTSSSAPSPLLPSTDCHGATNCREVGDECEKISDAGGDPDKIKQKCKKVFVSDLSPLYSLLQMVVL